MIASLGVDADDSPLLWRVGKSQPVASLPVGKSAAAVGAFSRNENELLVGTRSGAVRVYDLPSAKSTCGDAHRACLPACVPLRACVCTCQLHTLPLLYPQS